MSDWQIVLEACYDKTEEILAESDVIIELEGEFDTINDIDSEFDQ